MRAGLARVGAEGLEHTLVFGGAGVLVWGWACFDLSIRLAMRFQISTRYLRSASAGFADYRMHEPLLSNQIGNA